MLVVVQSKKNKMIQRTIKLILKLEEGHYKTMRRPQVEMLHQIE